VTFTATDDMHNSAICIMTIKYQGKKDVPYNL